MKKIRIAVIFAVIILAFVIPLGVFASYDIFYCSYNVSSGGDGTWKYPWACETAAEFDEVVDKSVHMAMASCTRKSPRVITGMSSNGKANPAMYTLPISIMATHHTPALRYLHR